MATAPIRQPAIQLVDSNGNPIANGGPFLFNVGGGAPATLGVTLDTIDAVEEAKVIGPWENFNWQTVSFPLGYKLHATLKFVQVESDPASLVYGLTLLHRIWSYSVANQLSFAGMQFRMFASGAFRPVAVNSFEWQPTFLAGKQAVGVYGVSMSIVTRDLVTTPGEWAQQTW